MKMFFLIVTATIVFFKISIAQMPPIDTAAIAQWPHIGTVTISPDGKYVLYYVGTGYRSRTKGWVIRAVNNNWQKQIGAAMDARITEDSRRLLYKTAGDTLVIQTLGEDNTQRIAGVTSFKTPERGTGRWTAYLRKQDQDMVLLDLSGGQTFSYASVDDYAFSPSGNVLLAVGKNSDHSSLLWVDLDRKKTDTIFQTKGTCGNF